jgi:hypothetical protein
MKPPLLPILVAIALSGCDRAAKASKAAPPPPAPLPIVAEAEIPAPASPTVTVEAGSNLRAIAAKAYGHEKFSGFVARLNDLPDPEQVTAGAILKTPSLPVAFREAGLDHRYQPAINALAKACTDFYDELPSYLEARKASGVERGTFAIPEKSRDTFLKCADAIDAARRELETAKEPHKAPRMTLDQFAQASSLLRELATGSIDGYGYDSDLIGQRLGLGFTNAIVWTQENHR